MFAPTCRIGWESLGAARAHFFEASRQSELEKPYREASKRMERLCAGERENKKLGRSG